MIEAWNAYWFAPGSGEALGFARLAILGYYLIFKLRDPAFDFVAWHDVRGRLSPFWRPPPYPGGFRGPQLTMGAVRGLAWLHRGTVLLATIGLFTELACLAAFVSGLPLWRMRHGLRMHHTVLPIKFCLLGFALAGAGDFYSLDALYQPASHDPSLYGWGQAYLRLLVPLAMFSAGIAKIRHSGWRWFSPGNLADLMRLHDYPYTFVRPAISLSKPLRRFPVIGVAISAGVQVMELGIIGAIFWDPLRWIFFPATILGVLSFRIFLGARFDLFAVILLVTLF